MATVPPPSSVAGGSLNELGAQAVVAFLWLLNNKTGSRVEDQFSKHEPPGVIRGTSHRSKAMRQLVVAVLGIQLVKTTRFKHPFS